MVLVWLQAPTPMRSPKGGSYILAQGIAETTWGNPVRGARVKGGGHFSKAVGP